MAKIFGINGKLVGKQGAAVYSVKNGVQVVKQYNPIVFNPNTKRQALARARFALASRWAIALAKSNDIAWALRKTGGKSGTNIQTSVMLKQSGLITGTDPSILQMAFDELVLAEGTLRQAAITGLPTFTNPLSVGVPSVPADDIMADLPSGYRVGIVWVVVCPDMQESVVRPVACDQTGLVPADTITVPSTWQGMNVHVYAYAKAVPESLLQIPTETYPWKYPAATSNSAYIGFGNIQ